MRARKKFRVDQAASHDVALAAQSHKPALKHGVPANTIVSFPPNAQGILSFDFAPHYGLGFDAIVSALQQTVEIFLAENTVEASTVSGYCRGGVKSLCDYLTLYRKGLNRELLLGDITVELLENYIQHLKINHPNGPYAKARYTQAKALLRQMLRMGWIAHLDFPKNPFPNSNKQFKGQKPFSKSERKRIAQALKKDVALILSKNEPLTAYEIVMCVLAIALRSGMNTTPLLEMTTDSIKDHPLKENRKLLVLYKRRGNATHIQSLRHAKEVENAQTVLADVAMIVEHIIRVNASMRAELGSDLVFIFKARGGGNFGQPNALSPTTLKAGIASWRKEHDLKNDNGDPLTINISRFRKTFENRIFELSGGDPFVTAKLSNSTVKVTDQHYLEAPVEAEGNFRLMGEVRTRELLSTVNVIENNTPVSKCNLIPTETDKDGNDVYCTKFLKCVRCRHMVVTPEDLYRLFSFYWLLVSEREQVGAKRWKKYFAHIIRIIDSDIAPQFDQDYVREVKERARVEPHPAWKHRHQLEEVA